MWDYQVGGASMKTLRRILYVARWPFALAVNLVYLPFGIIGAVIMANPEVLGEWWDMTYHMLFDWDSGW